MPEKKENLNSAANEKLKEKALDYLRRYSSDQTTLAENRDMALKAYRRDPYPEDARIVEGSRSKFVMSDTADTIEWIMPSLMRIFYSGKEVVKIEGQGPEDTDGAELLNNKVNWDFTRQNNGFLIFYDWFKASMLNKFSVVKYWWDSHEEYASLTFDDVTEDQLLMLQQDKDFIIDKATPVQSAMPEMPVSGMDPLQAGPTYKVEGRHIKKRVRRPVAEVVPPEEFICSLKTRNLKEEEFVAHRKRVHKFDLEKNYGVSEDELDSEAAGFNDLTNSDQDLYQRFHDLGGIGFFQDEDDKDFYYIYECFLKEDEKDQRTPIILTILGDRVIAKKENTYGHPPFCMNSPIRMPHRAIGMSIYDLTGDLQKLKSSLVRYNLNNIYYQTEGMMLVDPWKINVADFATQRRPGGVVRTTKEGVNINEAAWPVPVMPLTGHAVGLIDRVDSWKEKRTGVTSYNQGVDADSLNKTARGISEIMAASQQRVELIARIYAETGVRDLMTAFAEMNIEFLDIETNIRIDQKWAEVDQKSIDVLFDTTVDVALGTGSREMKIQQIGAMLDRSMNPTLIQSGVVQRENLYEMMKTMWIEMGYKNVDRYVTDPATLQPLLPPQPPGGMNGQPINGIMGPGPGLPGGAAPPQGQISPGSGMVQ